MIKPVQLQLDLDAAAPLAPAPLKYAGEMLKFDCPRPSRLGQDQFRCPLCGIVWDIDEPAPECQRTDVHESNRGTP